MMPPPPLCAGGAFAAGDWQPLLWASGENHIELARMLLDLGMDINEQQPITQISSKYSALHVVRERENELGKHARTSSAHGLLSSRCSRPALLPLLTGCLRPAV
jgi:ankyrin repeat protein